MSRDPRAGALGARIRQLRVGSSGAAHKPLNDAVQGANVSRPPVRQSCDDAALAARAGGRCLAPGLIEVVRRIGYGEAHGRERLSTCQRRRAGKPEAIYFDTETTGLAGGSGTTVFMFGFARHNPGAGAIETTQLLLTGFHGECAMLDRMAERLPCTGELVSYNGRSFDAPLVSTRARLNAKQDPLAHLTHMDLLYVARRAFSARWPDCRLGTVESRLLGFERLDDLPGSLAPQAWFDWVRDGSPHALLRVLTHNFWDVLSLAVLDDVLDRCLRDPLAWDASALAYRRHGTGRDGNDDEMLAYLSANAGRLEVDATMELARLARRAGSLSLARAAWERAAGAGSVEAVLELAKFNEHRAGNLDEALALVERLLVHEPGSLSHRQRRKRILQKRDSRAGAKPAFAPTSC